MTNVADEAFERLQMVEADVVAALNSTPNEADTRFRALDRILLDVLGWQRENILTDPPTGSGFIDYLIQTSFGRNLFVIEAKKSGLLAPETKSNDKMTIALDGPVAKPMKDGIRQALAYATEQGVPTAVLTDGKTWLFFRASRTDGRPPLKGKGILFPSWKSVVDYFVPFTELVSPRAVLDKRHLAHLNDAEGYVLEWKAGRRERNFERQLLSGRVRNFRNSLPTVNQGLCTSHREAASPSLCHQSWTLTDCIDGIGATVASVSISHNRADTPPPDSAASITGNGRYASFVAPIG